MTQAEAILGHDKQRVNITFNTGHATHADSELAWLNLSHSSHTAFFMAQLDRETQVFHYNVLFLFRL